MQKVSRRQRLMLTLPGLVLLAAFFIGGGVEAISGDTPTALAAGAQSAQPECVGEQRKPSFHSVIVVSSGEVVCGDLISFGGEVVIHGVVNGDVVAFGGNVVVDGVVNGTVTLYGGNFTSQNGAHIDGDIHICGGRWTREADSQLYGSIINCTKGVDLLLGYDGGVIFRLWSVLTWVVLGILVTTLLPEHVMLVRTTVKIKTRRSFALGLLSLLLAPIVIAVLLALIIAIPLAILVAVGLVAAWSLGTVAVGWIVGEYVLHKIAPHQDTYTYTRPMQVGVGLTMLALAGSLPHIGWLISLIAGLLGLGAVFLSRFGTRLYSQPRQPLPL
ncbi:MAG: hypothetical protein NVS2B12_33450 [Ktedonobacteraceae bacterium]